MDSAPPIPPREPPQGSLGGCRFPDCGSHAAHKTPCLLLEYPVQGTLREHSQELRRSIRPAPPTAREWALRSALCTSYRPRDCTSPGEFLLLAAEGLRILASLRCQCSSYPLAGTLAKP